jgi:N-6 DNA Methylase
VKLTYTKPLESIARNGFDRTRVLSAFMRLAACCLCGPTLRPEQWYSAVRSGVPAAFRMLQIPNREAQYLEEASHWDAKHMPLFAEAFHLMLEDAARYEYDDVLGTVYQEWAGLRVKQSTGEFYTPIEICYLMALMNLEPSRFSMDRAIDMNDASCGSGNMMLGAVRVTHELGYPSTQMLWVLQDISRTACDMAFINCCLYGVPALVSHRDTIRMTEWDANYTPWYPVAHGKLERAPRDVPVITASINKAPATTPLDARGAAQSPLFAFNTE